MEHHGHTHGAKAAAGEFRAAGAGRRGQLVAENQGKIDAAFFEQRPVGQDPAVAAAAGRSFPRIPAECRAPVEGLQARGNLVVDRP